MRLLLIFIAVPLIEIALFIQVGGLIGLWPTLLVVLTTAVIGTWLVRSQGLMALASVKSSFNELRDPTEPLAHGAMILFSGALLLTPGFFTDAIGFALLVPAIRHAAYTYLRSRVKVVRTGMGRPDPRSDPRYGVPPRGRQPDPRRETGGDVIEGDYEELPRDPDTPRGHSGWTRH